MENPKGTNASLVCSQNRVYFYRRSILRLVRRPLETKHSFTYSLRELSLIRYGHVLQCQFTRESHITGCVESQFQTQIDRSLEYVLFFFFFCSGGKGEGVVNAEYLVVLSLGGCGCTDNRITSIGAHALLGVYLEYGRSNIEMINLSKNPVGDQAFTMLKKLIRMQAFPRLTIDLSSTNINGSDCVSLHQALLMTNTPIRFQLHSTYFVFDPVPRIRLHDLFHLFSGWLGGGVCVCYRHSARGGGQDFAQGNRKQHSRRGRSLVYESVLQLVS